MNTFLRHVCKAARLCKGGIHCPYDRPKPSSSSGARRLAASKVRSRRIARASLREELTRLARER